MVTLLICDFLCKYLCASNRVKNVVFPLAKNFNTHNALHFVAAPLSIQLSVGGNVENRSVVLTKASGLSF